MRSQEATCGFVVSVGKHLPSLETLKTTLRPTILKGSNLFATFVWGLVSPVLASECIKLDITRTFCNCISTVSQKSRVLWSPTCEKPRMRMAYCGNVFDVERLARKRATSRSMSPRCSVDKWIDEPSCFNNAHHRRRRIMYDCIDSLLCRTKTPSWVLCPSR